MQQFRLSDVGFSLTKEFEGLRLEAYQDLAGIWTIGFGHTGPDVARGDHITQPEAEDLLHSDLQEAIACVNRSVNVSIEQHHFDALVDFCYNAGRGSFERSSLLERLNSGDFEGAASQFGAWVHVDAQTIPGLVRRRAAEVALFRGLPAERALPFQCS